MPTIFKIFLIGKALVIGWTYWFGNRKEISEDDLKEFENSLIIFAFLIYSPILIPMYIYKGIRYLFNMNEYKTSGSQTVKTHPKPHQPQSQQFVSKKECPVCHNIVKVGQKFCTNCGHDLSRKVVTTVVVDKPALDMDRTQKTDRVNLFLKTKGADFIVVYLTKNILGLSMEESKIILDSAPTYLPGLYDRTIALKYIEELKKNGAIAEIR